MRLPWIAPAALALVLAGCGASTPPAAPIVTGSLEGDAALVASAQAVSDAVGGCIRNTQAETAESRVVGLDGAAIVMLACSQGEFSYTHRLFAIRAGQTPQLISLPDYDGAWYGVDQASMAELDAGTGVLTTLRKGGEKETCGSEGRYTWNGTRFVVQEMHWQDCATSQLASPPFPVVWPTQAGADVDPNGATPAP